MAPGHSGYSRVAPIPASPFCSSNPPSCLFLLRPREIGHPKLSNPYPCSGGDLKLHSQPRTCERERWGRGGGRQFGCLSEPGPHVLWEGQVRVHGMGSVHVRTSHLTTAPLPACLTVIILKAREWPLGVCVCVFTACTLTPSSRIQVYAEPEARKPRGFLPQEAEAPPTPI